MTDRVVVFIDYQNVHGWARRQFFSYGCNPAEGHIDPLRTAQHLCERRRRESSLKQVRVYRGRPNPGRQPGSAGANDRQAAAWARSPLVEVVRRNLYYPQDYPTSPAVEKGIDVAIAVDMVRLAVRQELDVAILFSSDNDLLPAIETLMNERLCHVEVAAWERGHRLRLGDTQSPWCHNVNRATFETLRDSSDYSAPPRQPFPPALRPRRG